MRLELTASSAFHEDFGARIDSNAATRPDAVAVSDGNVDRSWRQLSGRVRRGSVVLSEMTAGSSGTIALLSENSIAFVEAFFSIVISGRCAVTVPTMLRADAMARVLEDASPSLILVSEKVSNLLQDSIASSHRLQGVRVLGLAAFQELVGRTRDIGRPAAVTAEEEFNIVYSSGTTGEPKGIVHTHRTRVAQASGMAGLGFDTNTVTLVSTPLYTNLSLPALLATVWCGGETLIMDKFREREFLDLAARERATHFYLVPIQVERLIGHPEFVSYDLSATRLVYIAGSTLRMSVKQELLDLWPGTLVEVYGMTEGAPASVLFIRDDREKLASVGRPVPGCDVRVIGEDDDELPVGQVGEIVGRSGTMMKGYLNRPAETEGLVWRDQQGLRYFRTGDIGRFDEDGYLYIVDRKKDMIISGGLNIYASDIEGIAATHAMVAEVAVVGVPSRRWGETPVAVVVPKPDVSIDKLELRDWINARVASHQRVAAVEVRSSLPRNALGKILKRQLRTETTHGVEVE